RRFAVHEHDRFAADRDAQSFGPISDVGLTLRLTLVGGSEYRLVGEVTGQPIPEFPAVAVKTLVDHQRPGGAHHLHGLGASLIEVTDEQRVGATDFASTALHAVDIV